MVKEKLDNKSSIHENTEIEGMFDVICSEIGFEKETKVLRDNIRIFGKMRFNQGVDKMDIRKWVKLKGK